MTEVREAAETILFGETLSAKMTSLRGLVDEAPGEPRDVPRAPGRPASLRRRERAARDRFPSLAELDDEGARGRLLHFLANHELLALELMALVLLRFPDAPRERRRGLVAIMADEQRHLASYLERMEELGTGFGDVEVGWSFWDALSGVESPAAFDAGMSITLEQANLDHAAALACAMGTIGDERTRLILEGVLTDEIRHVRHGVGALPRRPEESLWDAWVRQLPATLAPVNARGHVFRRDLRLRAGLDPDFIDRLEVEAAARPRRPDVWWFDPGCEEELAGATSEASSTVRRALEALPLLLAREGDLVVTEEPVEAAVVAGLRALGLGKAAVVREESVRDSSPASLRPWGRGPAAARFAAGVGCDSLLGWRDDMATAYRKSHGVSVAAETRAALGAAADPRLCADEDEGQVARSVGEVAAHVEKRLERTGAVVLKADFKTAGRKTRRVEARLTSEDEAWCARILATHGAVVVEPWLDRVLDLSTHLTLTQDGVRFDGVVRFETDERGAFLGAWASPSHRGLDSELARFVSGDGDVGPLAGPLRAFAEPAARAAAALGFTGPVAVDALIHRERGGRLALRPLVELNPRLTMGRVALELGRRVARNAPAYWAVATSRRLSRLAPDGLAALLAAHPPRIERGADGPRLVSGIVPTTTRRADADVVTLLGVGEAAGVLARD